MSLIPPAYADAVTEHPEVDRWCTAVLAGQPSRLLILGPIWSGKTYTAYAALRRLLDAGFPEDDLHVVDGGEVRSTLSRYDPSVMDAGPLVTFFDDLTGQVDNRAGRHPDHYVADEPEIQAAMAAGAGALIDAVERLVSRYGASWIACASGSDQLAECLGDDVSTRLLESAHITLDLPARPQPD